MCFIMVIHSNSFFSPSRLLVSLAASSIVCTSSTSCRDALRCWHTVTASRRLSVSLATWRFVNVVMFQSLLMFVLSLKLHWCHYYYGMLDVQQWYCFIPGCDTCFYSILLWSHHHAILIHCIHLILLYPNSKCLPQIVTCSTLSAYNAIATHLSHAETFVRWLCCPLP